MKTITDSNIFSGEYVKIHHFIKQAKYDDAGVKFFCYLFMKYGIHFGNRVLDLACGQGQDMQYMRNQDYVVDGIDASDDMLKYARKNNPDAELMHSTAEKLDAEDVYRAVYCLVTFGMFVDQKAVCNNVAYALKNDGIFVFDYWNKLAFEDGISEYDENIGIERHVKRCVKDGICSTIYDYSSIELSIKHDVKLFDLWDVHSLLSPYLSIVDTYSGYSNDKLSWNGDKYITIVAEKVRRNE